MNMHAKTCIGLITLAAFLFASATFAQTDPASLPGRDQHENFLVAATVCADEKCSHDTFGKKNPYKAGILAVEVYLQNESAEPLRVGLDDIRLDISGPAGRQELTALSPEDVARMIVNPGGSSPQKSRVPGIGLGLPKSGSDQEKVAQNIEPLTLDTDLLGPHATVHGYMFFNLGNDFSLVGHSSLYVPNVRTLTGNHHLMYFEVSLKMAQKQ